MSVSAAAARCRCLPPPAAWLVPRALGPRQSMPLPLAAWRRPRAKGGGPKTGRCQGNHIHALLLPPSTLPYTHATLCLPTRPSVTRPQLSLPSPYCAPPPPHCQLLASRHETRHPLLVLLLEKLGEAHP